MPIEYQVEMSIELLLTKCDDAKSELPIVKVPGVEMSLGRDIHERFLPTMSSDAKSKYTDCENARG